MDFLYRNYNFSMNMLASFIASTVMFQNNYAPYFIFLINTLLIFIFLSFPCIISI